MGSMIVLYAINGNLWYKKELQEWNIISTSNEVIAICQPQYATIMYTSFVKTDNCAINDIKKEFDTALIGQLTSTQSMFP